MAIAASGAVSLEDFRTEFVGGSSAVSLGDLYRGGSHIRAKAGNNSATNLAASVPTSGTIDFNDFYSTAKAFRYTYTSGATNQDASNLFGSDYGVNYPKEIVINSGVELGATSTGQEALQIDSGLSGGLTITNNGTLSGAGGSAGGGTGGDAFEADVACTLINNGTIRAGGGGGGAGGSGGTGGTGGQGSQSYAYWGNSEGPYGQQSGGSSKLVFYNGNGHPGAPSSYSWYWNSNSPNLPSIAGSQQTVGNHRYTRGGTYAQAGGGAYGNFKWYQITRETYLSGTNYFNGGSGGSGGSGGAGGAGQGYGQSAASGSSGSSGSGGSGGGTNAGSGGTGGTGGTGGSGGGYGASGSSGNTGSTGNTGGNGNHSNGSGGSGGSGGSSGGAAGKYIRGLSNVTLTQNGTVQGGTA